MPAGKPSAIEHDELGRTAPEGKMVDLLESEFYQRKRKGMTFSEWMEARVSGLELWPW
jgi:hypothetical protein